MIKALLCLCLAGLTAAIPLGLISDDLMPEWMPFSGSYGPYMRYGSQIYKMFADVMDDEPWPLITSTASPFDTMYPWNSPITTTDSYNQYNPYFSSIDNINNNMIPGPTSYPLTMDPSLLTQGYTPYSRMNLFRSVVTPTVGKGRLFMKKFLAHVGLLNRKLHSECPEVDGGMSYLTCLLDARSVGVECLKKIEDHPQFHVCKRNPIVKKALRDSFVTEVEWMKRMVTCMASPSINDEMISQTEYSNILSPISSIDEDIKDVEDMEPMTPGYYNVDVVNTERQCVWKVRSKQNKCDMVALRCPKFKRCFFHPIINSLKIQRRLVHTRLATVVDQCLQGSLMPIAPFTGISNPSLTPFSSNIPF